jgi:D-arabinose 1-dehydrogenase-like Zn-dependent alcohol dehydrogenase
VKHSEADKTVYRGKFEVKAPPSYLSTYLRAQIRALKRPRSGAPFPMAVKHTRIIVTHYGEPGALQVVEEERPEPQAGEARVRVLAAGVSLPDLMAREGIHPETPSVPFTPGWDLVSVVDRLGSGVSGIETDQIVAAMPISGAYAEFVCLPQRELIPVPPGLDAAEAVSPVLNYITAYQTLHRSAKVRQVGSARRYCSLGASPGWRCMALVRRAGHQPFPSWAVSQ